MARSVLARHALAPDIQGRVAERLIGERLLPVVGEGELARPFPDASSGSVALLHVLYHLRSRSERCHDSSEFARALPRMPLTFDAELLPELLATLVADVEIDARDAPLLELPTRAAVRDYLIGKGVERAAAEAEPNGVEVPLVVTERGALAVARKR